MRDAACWLPSLVFLAHVAEEFPRFPAWATRHFGTTTRAFYVYSHLPLIAALLAISAGAAASSGGTWVLLLMACQWVLCTNAVFHLATTAWFREYSPGVVTGTLLFLPSTIYVLQIARRVLSGPQLASALSLGTVVGGLVVASLWLDMDFDWRLRRARG